MQSNETPIFAVVKINNEIIFEGQFVEAYNLHKRLDETLRRDGVAVILDVFQTANWRANYTFYKGQLDAAHAASYAASTHGASKEVLDALHEIVRQAADNVLPYDYMAQTVEREAMRQTMRDEAAAEADRARVGREMAARLTRKEALDQLFVADSSGLSINDRHSLGGDLTPEENALIARAYGRDGFDGDDAEQRDGEPEGDLPF